MVIPFRLAQQEPTHLTALVDINHGAAIMLAFSALSNNLTPKLAAA
jgi:hypothetical protein